MRDELVVPRRLERTRHGTIPDRIRCAAIEPRSAAHQRHLLSFSYLPLLLPEEGALSRPFPEGLPVLEGKPALTTPSPFPLCDLAMFSPPSLLDF